MTAPSPAERPRRRNVPPPPTNSEERGAEQDGQLVTPRAEDEAGHELSGSNCAQPRNQARNMLLCSNVSTARCAACAALPCAPPSDLARRSASSARVMASNRNVMATTWARNQVVREHRGVPGTVPKRRRRRQERRGRLGGDARQHPPAQADVDGAHDHAHQLRVRAPGRTPPRTAAARRPAAAGTGSSAVARRAGLGQQRHHVLEVAVGDGPSIDRVRDRDAALRATPGPATRSGCRDRCARVASSSRSPSATSDEDEADARSGVERCSKARPRVGRQTIRLRRAEGGRPVANGPVAILALHLVTLWRSGRS